MNVQSVQCRISRHYRARVDAKCLFCRSAHLPYTVALSLTTRKTTAKQPDDEADHKACFHIFDHKPIATPSITRNQMLTLRRPAFSFSFIVYLFLAAQPG